MHPSSCLPPFFRPHCPLVIAPPRRSLPFRFVLSPGPTAPVTLCLSPRLKWADPPQRSAAKHVEVCPAAAKISLDVASRIATDGGAALIIDYGQDGLVSDSLQAIKRHRFVHVFETPGEADLSAHVDFAAIKAAIKEAKGTTAAAVHWGSHSRTRRVSSFRTREPCW